ncbi:MAG: DUF4861 domain-containing protein [Flavitalea sp.]
MISVPSMYLLLFLVISGSTKEHPIEIHQLNESPKEHTIEIINSLKFERTDELIVLPRASLEKKLGKIDQYVSVSVGSTIFPVQFDDLDQDGRWDEAALVCNFKANEKVSFAISLNANNDLSTFPVRAQVLLKKMNEQKVFQPSINKEIMEPGRQATDFSKVPLPLYQMEGPAWENDKVGFRLYFDVRNGKDIWGKLTGKMILQDVGTGKGNSYHELNDWGMDLLKVGNSLGAGSLAIQTKKVNARDTLVRVGGNNMGSQSYTMIANGPVRAIFLMKYENWNMLGDGNLVNIEETVSISAGQYYYQSEVTVSGIKKKYCVVTGIVNLKSKEVEKFNKPSRGIYTFDKQSENNDQMGMAIITLPEYFESSSDESVNTGDINKTYAVKFSPRKNPVYRFYANWEKSDERFNSLSSYQQYISREGERMAIPLKIKW